jgi:hypothetical protein
MERESAYYCYHSPFSSVLFFSKKKKKGMLPATLRITTKIAGVRRGRQATKQLASYIELSMTPRLQQSTALL